MSKTRGTDDRQFDTTQLHEAHHGKMLHRDYSAHFFRWSFAKRHIEPMTKVLEIGCGQDLPLLTILTSGSPNNRLERYIGCDLNKIKKKPNRSTMDCRILDEFDVISRADELPTDNDYIVHFEVIEHMQRDLGQKLLETSLKLLRPGGTLLLSTPVFNGKQANNHIHEYEVEELQNAIQAAGFIIEQRFGTFGNTLVLKKAMKADGERGAAALRTWGELSQYYDDNALSCIFAPLYPDAARNNLWVCRKPA